MFQLLVGPNDVLNKRMPDHVDFREVDEADVGCFLRIVSASISPDPFSNGRSIWVTSPVMTALEP